MPIKKYEMESEYFARLKKQRAREMQKEDRYGIEELPNGFIKVFDYGSGLQALLNEDGSYRSGDISARAAEYAYKSWLKEQGRESWIDE